MTGASQAIKALEVVLDMYVAAVPVTLYVVRIAQCGYAGG